MRYLLVTLLLVLVCHEASWAGRNNSDRRILWGVPSWQPYSHSPNDKNAPGSINILLKIVTNNIQGFESAVIESSVPKAYELWKNGTDICSPVVLYTKERESLAYMTPFVVLPPLELIARVSKKEFLGGSNKPVDLAKIIKDKHWRGVFVLNRSYGELIDEILEQNENEVWRVTAPQGDWLNILHMVGSRRADYTVEYSVVAHEYNKAHTALEQLASIPIKGYNKPFQFMIACTRSSKGKEWIKAIDKALLESAKSPVYRDYVEELFLPEDRIKFKKDIDEFMERRAKGPWFVGPSD
ncbi:MAG: hypothetical protein ACKOX6_09445 [Bdellovibrio sp.]